MYGDHSNIQHLTISFLVPRSLCFMFRHGYERTHSSCIFSILINFQIMKIIFFKCNENVGKCFWHPHDLVLLPSEVYNLKHIPKSKAYCFNVSVQNRLATYFELGVQFSAGERNQSRV